MRLATSLAAAMLTGAALSGCGANPEPRPMPAPSSSTTPSATPSPTPPTMPAAAKKKTKQGAIAFVRHSSTILNYARPRADTAVLDNYEAPECGSCKSVRHDIRTLYKAGGSLEGGAWRLDRILGSDPAA